MWVREFLFIFATSSVSSLALSCYQCNSSVHDSCTESVVNLGEYSLKSEPCQTYDARYCIKTTGIYGAVMGTTRFCSAWDLGNECQYLPFPDHDRIYRACIFTCDSDACNGALTIKTGFCFITIFFFLSAWLIQTIL
ncbi:Boudin [Fasciola hepatica]|uniref:Boudin n=1 Tax=Fasciola hepatica TaxID=6192 RepID=A0A4E0RXG4_FASHE|nr:Boudin [Fasciola hepatica]